MKERTQGAREKKYRAKIAKYFKSFWRTVGTFTESLLIKQGFSKRFAKKVVWGEKKRGGKR